MEPANQTSPWLAAACRSRLRLALLAFVACSLVLTVYRVRDDPRELAFVAGTYSVLAALLLCLRRAERLTPDSPAGDRRRLQAAIWVLSTVLSLAFTYGVAALMPPAMAALVWSMTATVVLAGLYYMIVLCKDPRYRRGLGAATSDRVASRLPRRSDDAGSGEQSTKDGRVLMVALLLFLAYSLAQTARRVREEPWDVAFVVLGYSDLAALFWCMWRAECLVMKARSSLAAREERRRLKVTVWALSTVLSCAFTYRVSLDMTASLAVVVWCMTSSIVLASFYVSVVCNDQAYGVVEDFGDAGNGHVLGYIEPAHELV